MEHEKLNTEETANSGLAAVSGSFDLNIEARKIIVNKYPYLPFDQWGYFEDMLAACGFSIGQKVQVFDGQKWEKTGDIGDNECFWIEATITGCNINVYKELLIEVLMVDGRTSLGYYKEGVRHCR